MDRLTFTANIVGHLAWPAATFGIFILLRKQLSQLVLVISRVKVSSFEVEFNRRLEIAKEEAISELPPASSDENFLPSLINPNILNVAEVSPRAAVMEAWHYVEAAALRAANAQANGELFTRKTMTFRAISIIEKSGALPESIGALLRQLRRLRNDAAHAPDFTLSTASAIEYFHLAAQVASYLDGIATAKPK